MSKSASSVIAVIGTADFQRRAGALIRRDAPLASVITGTSDEGWSLVVSDRPELLFFEIGLRYSSDQHERAAAFLKKVRERFEQKIRIILVLRSCENFLYGGDLLFGNGTALEGSGLVDAFIVQPPAGMPLLPTLEAQLSDVLQVNDYSRGTELPALNSAGWAHSFADPKSRDLWFRWLPRYASYTNESAIIIGPTGTGKTNLAYALHALSGRPGKFVSITPRDFSSSELVQAELFGSVAGAYTDATDRWGLVKSAERGTLFIDELQSIDKDLQGKLITFIENKFYRRVGSSESISADVRFVFASNRSLADLLRADVLRDDFAYRLERVQLDLPALRERPLDIPAAIAFALAKVRRQRPSAKAITGCEPRAYALLVAQQWPGNLRQLENAVAKLCEACEMEGATLLSESAVIKLFGTGLFERLPAPSHILRNAALSTAQQILAQDISSLEPASLLFTSAARREALQTFAGDISSAAKAIGENEALMRYEANNGLQPAKRKK